MDGTARMEDGRIETERIEEGLKPALDEQPPSVRLKAEEDGGLTAIGCNAPAASMWLEEIRKALNCPKRSKPE